MSATLEMETLMTTLRGATDEQWKAFMVLQHERGIPLFNAAVDAKEVKEHSQPTKEVVTAANAPEPAKKVAKKEPKPKAEKPEKAAVSLPSGEDGEPDASEYRIADADIDHSTCIARAISDSCKDTRWNKAVYREQQCGKKVVDGDLCKRCAANEEKYAEEAKSGAPWKGRIGEDPLDWLHMLGTAWAEKAKPVFKSSGSSSAASVSDSASVTSDAAEEKAEKAEKPEKAKAGRKPAADKEEKAAAAAAEKAKKAEAAAAKKEAAEAKKAAAEEEKAAKKEAAEAKKAAAEAEKASKPAKTKKEKPEAKVAKVAEPTEVEFELKMIGDIVYAIKNGNVYEWDADAEKKGTCVGRLTGDDEDPSIDTDAEEVL